MTVTGLSNFSGAAATMVTPLYPGVVAAQGLAALQGRFRIQISSGGAQVAGGRRVLPEPKNLTNQLLTTRVVLITNSVGDVPADPETMAGFVFVLYSGTAYAAWNIWGADGPIGSAFQLVLNPANTSYRLATSGAFDVSNITAFELIINRTGSSGQSWFSIEPIWMGEELVVTGGTEASPLNYLDDLVTYSSSFTSASTQSGGPFEFATLKAFKTKEIFLPFSVQANHSLLDAETFTFAPLASYATKDLRLLLNPGDLYIDFDIPANGVSRHTFCGFKAENKYGWTSAVGAGGLLEFISTPIDNADSVTITPGESHRGGAIRGGAITLAGGNINSTALIDSDSIDIDSLGTVAISSPENAGIFNINLPPGDYLQFRFTLEPGQELNITQGAGTYTFTGLSGGTEADPVIIDSTSLGEKTVVVDADFFAVAADPVTDGSVVIQAPQVSLSAPGIKDPTYPISVALLRQETFVIPDITAAINTTANTLTLADHRLTITAPASFLGLIPQTGATMPTDADGPLEPLGLYFVESISGDEITLSRSEGGTTINLLTAGTGTFVVRAWTQLDYELVPAGSTTGYSVSLSEPAGTTLLLKARGHQNEDLPATATEYLIREVAWGGTSQSVPDTLNFSATPDTSYNAITAASEYTNDGESVTGISFDFDGTVQFDFDGGATLPTQDVYAWYVHYTSTEEGILYVGDVVQALNSANINIAPPIQFENIDVGTVLRLTGAFIRRTDGANLTFIGPTSGVIEYDFDQLAVPFTVATGSGLDSTQATQLATAATVATRVDGLIEDDDGDQFTAKAVSQAGGGGSGDAPTEAEIYGYFTSDGREDVFKADVSGLATPGDIPSADIAEIKSKTDNLPAVPASQGDVTTVGDAVAALNDLDAAGIRSALGMADADLDTQLDAILAAIDGIDPSDLSTVIAALDEIKGDGWDDRYTLEKIYLHTTKRVRVTGGAD